MNIKRCRNFGPWSAGMSGARGVGEESACHAAAFAGCSSCLSGEADVEAKLSCLRAGLVHNLTKPFNMDELVAPSALYFSAALMAMPITACNSAILRWISRRRCTGRTTVERFDFERIS